MRTLYLLNVTLHVLAAMLWLGGMFFLAVVGGPVLRRLDDAGLRARLFRDLGGAFRRVGWWSILVLVLTGIGNLAFRGVLSVATLTSSSFWRTPFGDALAGKLIAVAAMLAVSAVHDFLVGPAAGRAARSASADAERLRGWASWLARVNAGLGVVVVLLAVRLARGG